MVLHGVGESLVSEDRPDLVAGEGQAVVRLRAAALNHRDVWIRKGQYAGLKFPIVPGSDGVGTVTAGPSEWVGKDVIVNPSLGWGSSEAAKADTFRILGLPEDGTFAQEVLVPAENLVEKPAFLQDENAAALPLAGLTAYRALFSRAGLQRGERVLITGAGGGAASLALRFAVAAGAKVWATTSGEEKIRRAEAMGATQAVDYRHENWEKELGTEFDVIVDSAGGEGFLKLFDVAAPGGRIVFFGATAGDPPAFPMRKVFWKQLSVLGTTMGSPKDFSDLANFVSEQQLVPDVDETFPLARVNEALDRMASGQQAGKIVLQIP
jgi:NADPH:quinone reductase-like Zn-dependent oxidoreductase